MNVFNNASSDLQKEIDDVYEQIDQLSRSYRKQLNKQNANINPMAEVINDEYNDNKSVWNKFKSKDIFIIGLLFMNVVTIIYFSLCFGRKKSTHKQLQ